ncbi:immunoglobulin superfamily member 1-like isoform X4 [Tachysurus vachellii]|uniref:immunoglobulin superfamily member 1-like isoform X4 n=1 Tax=Tachysurus vachellii TaxID=175792 RepID=UPI00296AD2FE|nr:immunoglobulin superfamily member 1-like isoform X4 [Tachysurus vachellii]
MELRPLCVMFLLTELILCTQTGDLENPKPVVIIKPDKQVFSGETVTFKCEINSTKVTKWTYSLYKYNDTENSYNETQEFIISSVTVSNSGTYTCRGKSSDSQFSEDSDPVTLTVSEKPKPQLTSSLEGDVLRGNSVNLSCTLTPKSAGWKFYWSKPTQSSETETETKAETETTSDFKTISLDKVYDSIQYRCRAGRGNQVFTDYSNVLSLTVIEKPKPVVIITPDKEVFRGEKVTFKCEIRSTKNTEWTYSWYKKDYTENPYKETQEFIISSVTDSDSGTYICRGKSSDSQFSEDSDPVTLTVSEKPKPELTSSLKGAVLRGNSVTLSCTLTPQSAGWKFYWSKYTQSSETEAEDETTSDSYTFSSDKVYDGIQYWCRAGRGNQVFTDYSNVLSLTVIESPKPTVTINPDTQVFIGETVTFRCDVQKGRDTEWTYDWFRDSNTLYPYSTTKEFSIRSVTDSHRGQYTCRGRRTSDSQMSQMSDSVTLSVSRKPKPTVIVTPQSSVYTGDNVTLSCNLMSTGWKFLWYKGPTWNSQYIGASDTKTHTVRVSNEGQVNYYCKAHRGNYYSEMSKPATITMRARPKPEVKVQPADHGFVFTGENVTFSCEIKTGGSWEYHWFRDNKELGDVKGKKIYKITDVKESHKGVYTCKGTQSSDPQYTETSDAVTLTVSEKPKPELTSDLKGAALTGNSVILSCTLKLQSAGWKFYWIKPTQSSETETETHQYIISSVRVSDGGQYRCRAGRGNPVYYTDYSDVLWVNVTVSLVIRPSRTQHFTADSLSLSCEDQSDSTGWTVRRYTHNETSFNCSSVSGSTCNISSLSTSHTGVYWCQSESGERSNSVNITVHNGDLILDSPVHPVTEGQPLTLHCLNRSKLSVSGVNFYKNDSILQNQTTGEMIISSVSKSDEGFYHCKHPERGESPKSWVSVSISVPRFTGLFIGLGLACLFAIVMILLILLFKKKKGVQSQSPAVNQDTNQPAVGDNIYENAAIMVTAASSNTVYPQVMARKKKQNDDAVRGPQDVLYSKIEMKLCNKESDAEPSDVTYAEIDMKHIKKPKRKQGKSSEGADTVYSELKQNTDNEDLAETGDVTYAQVIMKGKKYNAGKITENADQTYAQVRIKAKNAGP